VPTAAPTRAGRVLPMMMAILSIASETIGVPLTGVISLVGSLSILNLSVSPAVDSRKQHDSTNCEELDKLHIPSSAKPLCSR
jgi:hypothetical protein